MRIQCAGAVPDTRIGRKRLTAVGLVKRTHSGRTDRLRKFSADRLAECRGDGKRRRLLAARSGEMEDREGDDVKDVQAVRKIDLSPFSRDFSIIFRISTSRSFGGALVTHPRISRSAAAVTSSTAR